jgi:hypothetical protein
MPDVRSNIVPLEFASLTKKQKRWVRKLAWESLKGEAQFIVVIPWVTGCLGAMIGFFAGAFLCRLAFPDYLFRCFVVCAVIGAGIGAWIGRMWLERECQPHFRDAIRGNEDRISRIV